jgi:hypothetical protein
MSGLYNRTSNSIKVDKVLTGRKKKKQNVARL